MRSFGWLRAAALLLQRRAQKVLACPHNCVHGQEISVGKASLYAEGRGLHGNCRHLARGERQWGACLHYVDDVAGAGCRALSRSTGRGATTIGLGALDLFDTSREGIAATAARGLSASRDCSAGERSSGSYLNVGSSDTSAMPHARGTGRTKPMDSTEENGCESPRGPLRLANVDREDQPANPFGWHQTQSAISHLPKGPRTPADERL